MEWSDDHALLEVRRGDAPALQMLVSALEARFGGVIGLVEGEPLTELPPRSLVVLRARVEDAPALNLARPVLLHNHLRVVLFAEGDVAGDLRRAAPDLASWILQSFEPDPIPAPFGVAGLRRAFSSGAGIGVEWRGRDLDPALVAAGIDVVAEVDGAASYRALVDALRASPPGVVRVSGPPWLDVARLGWALAEAGREGTALRVAEADTRPSQGWWHVHGTAASWNECAAKLPGPRGAVLAALLGCEPEAVAIAAERLARGHDVEALIRQAQGADPGAAIAQAPTMPLAGSPPEQRADDGAGWGSWAAARMTHVGHADEPWEPEEGEIAALVAVTREPLELWPDDGFPARWVEAAGALVRGGEESGSPLPEAGGPATASAGAEDGRLERAAWLARAAGRTDVAAVWTERLVAAREGRVTGEPWARTLRLLARVRMGQGAYEAAGVVLNEALNVCASSGLEYASLLHMRGWLRLRIGDLAAARTDLEAAVSAAASLSDGLLEARSLSTLARTWRELGNLPEATRYIDQALARLHTTTEGEERIVGAHLLRVRATIALKRGEDYAARVDLEEAITQLRGLVGWEFHPELRIAQRHMAVLQREAGNVEDARREFLELLTLARREQHPRRVAVLLQELAAVEIASGAVDAAVARLEESVTTLRSQPGLRGYMPTALQRLAEVRVAQGDSVAARALYSEALEAQRALGPGGRSMREVDISEALGELLIREGDEEAGRELLRSAHAVTCEVLGREDVRAVGLAERVGGEVRVGEKTGLEEALRRIEECRAERGRVLDLAGLGLVDLPQQLRGADWVEELRLWDNAFERLPDWIGELRSLRMLSVPRNRDLRQLPNRVCELANLDVLILDYTSIRELPPLLWQCPLRKVSLEGLELSEVPTVLERCATLQVLDLSENRLGSLPGWLRGRQLGWLNLNYNPGLCIPRELAWHNRWPEDGEYPYQADPAAVQALLAWYFRTRARDGQPLNEVKLLLIGRGEAGKTAIRNRLIRGQFRKTRETQGIDIQPWTLPVGDQTIKVNVWDFAGQTITHATHQFFLTERSVYVLVLTGRGDMQKSDADYWLRLIQAFGTERAASGSTSPVIVALNKWDDHPFKLDRNALRDKYPFIAGFVETDCKSGLGIDTLTAQLTDAIARLESVRLPFPGAWWAIKERLEETQRKKSWIPWSEFQAVCTELGEETDAEQQNLARILHALGIALNYADDPRLRNATVLNPRWVTDSIYRVLREAVNDAAELTLADVQRVLPREKAEMRRYLVELMRRFDLAFPLSDADDRWLVPQRLPEEQPVLGPEWRVATATRLRFTYPILPEGLLPRFITRTWPLSASGTAADSAGGPLPRWVNGVVLEDAGARALVRADREEREVSVVVIGEPTDRPSLLAVIRAELAKIHEDIPGLNPREEVLVEGGQGWVPVATLRADERRRGTSAASTEHGTIELSPSRELDRLSDRAGRDPTRWRARVFVSYSSREARLRDELLMRLKPLEVSRGLVSTWHDRCLTPGEPWDRRIRHELEHADVILLLVSASFLASDYIRDVELARAMERADAGEAVVVPVLLERCDWEGEPFARFAALPAKARPIRDWKPQSNGIHEVVTGLRNLLEDLQRRR